LRITWQSPPGSVGSVGTKVVPFARRLADAAEPLARFLSEARMLGSKLGPALAQLPPSLAFRPDRICAISVGATRRSRPFGKIWHAPPKGQY